MDKILQGIIKEVAEEEGVSIEEVEKVLVLPYKMIRSTIIGLDIRDKPFSELPEGIKTNFNMPSLFKLYLNDRKLDKIYKINKSNE